MNFLRIIASPFVAAGRGFVAVYRWITRNPEALAAALDKARYLVAIAASIAPAKTATLAQIIAVYDRFGAPVSRALADGVLTIEEAKELMTLMLAGILRQSVAMSSTQATMLLKGAYEDLKEGDGTVFP